MPFDPDAENITHPSIITKETVYIAITMAVLHDTADILNTDVMVPNREKIYICHWCRFVATKVEWTPCMQSDIS